MANSHDEDRARASPANACPALRPAPNIPRAPRVVTCWPSTPDFFPNTIGTIAANPPLSPPIARRLRLSAWTWCSTQTVIPATRPPAHSPRRHLYEQFPARRQGQAEWAPATAPQELPYSSRAWQHRAACAGRFANGRTLRGWRAWCLRHPLRRQRSCRRAARGFPSPWPPANAAAPERMVFRLRDPAHKVAARAPDQSASPAASLTRSWRGRIIHGSELAIGDRAFA